VLNITRGDDGSITVAMPDINDNPLARFRSRIVATGFKPANQFTANPLNWREHPPEQRQAMQEILAMFGWIAGVIENQRTGNLIDGHERIWDALDQDEQTLVPFTLVDVSEEEEKQLLVFFDKVGEMIYANRENLRLLMGSVGEEVTNENDGLRLLANMIQHQHLENEKAYEPPDEFPEHDEEIDTEYCCPKCGYEWSGKAS